jgi:hypothetical protein
VATAATAQATPPENTLINGLDTVTSVPDALAAIPGTLRAGTGQAIALPRHGPPGYPLDVFHGIVATEKEAGEMTAPAPGEGIEASGRHNPLAWILYLIPLTVEVDGQATSGPWNQSRFIPVPAGEHNVSIYFPYLWMSRCCEGKAVVRVTPGQFTRVVYRAPVFVFSPGKVSVG